MKKNKKHQRDGTDASEKRGRRKKEGEGRKRFRPGGEEGRINSLGLQSIRCPEKEEKARHAFSVGKEETGEFQFPWGGGGAIPSPPPPPPPQQKKKTPPNKKPQQTNPPFPSHKHQCRKGEEERDNTAVSIDQRKKEKGVPECAERGENPHHSLR